MRLDVMAENLGAALKLRQLKLVTAESCTGGGLSYWITQIPGSSDWFERGLVTYSNEAKIELLGVSKVTLDVHGAVSEKTAREMADGALKHSHAQVSIAITGIAGPDGGTADKPVGTVWIAMASTLFPTVAYVNHFPGDRHSIRTETIKSALEECLVLIK